VLSVNNCFAKAQAKQANLGIYVGLSHLRLGDEDLSLRHLHARHTVKSAREK